MTLTPITKAVLAYSLLVALAIGLLLLHIGGILPGLLLMGVVMGILHLSSLLCTLDGDDDEPPCDPRL